MVAIIATAVAASTPCCGSSYNLKVIKNNAMGKKSNKNFIVILLSLLYFMCDSIKANLVQLNLNLNAVFESFEKYAVFG